MLRPYRTNLVWYSGNYTSEEYFVFGPDGNGAIAELDLKTRLLKGPLLCLEGEPDLDNLMAGNFEPLRRNDCSLRVNEITRWAWEAWRLAVGVKVGQIFPKAVGLMNQGAKSNGNLNINHYLCFT